MFTITKQIAKLAGPLVLSACGKWLCSGYFACRLTRVQDGHVLTSPEALVAKFSPYATLNCNPIDIESRLFQPSDYPHALHRTDWLHSGKYYTGRLFIGDDNRYTLVNAVYAQAFDLQDIWFDGTSRVIDKLESPDVAVAVIAYKDDHETPAVAHALRTRYSKEVTDNTGVNCD